MSRAPASSAVLVMLAELGARVSAVEQALAARAPRPADAALLQVLAEETGGRVFGAVELLAHARVSPRLAVALEAACLEGPRELGCWLRGAADRGAVDGLRLVRDKRSGRGRGWRVVTMC